MNGDIRAILKEDIEQFCDALSELEVYSFPLELQRRMQLLRLSSTILAERAGVSHTIVDKWRKGKARPNGKERMKELGMALGMDATELDALRFL